MDIYQSKAPQNPADVKLTRAAVANPKVPWVADSSPVTKGSETILEVGFQNLGWKI